MKPILIFLFALFFTNCTNQPEILKTTQLPPTKTGQKIATSPTEVNNESTVKTALDVKRYEDSIKNTKGLIVLSDQYGKNDFIRFYNEDGSIWYEFTYYYDDSDGNSSMRMKTLLPTHFIKIIFF
jgi:hypothetical protein